METFTTINCAVCGASIMPGSSVPHVCAGWMQGTYPFYVPAIESVNDYLACEPFKQDVTDVVNKGTGFNTMKGFTTLTGLKVIFGNKDYPAGQTVYVRADLSKDVATKMQYDIDGQKIVLIPIKEIRLVKRFDPKSWGVTTVKEASEK